MQKDYSGFIVALFIFAATSIVFVIIGINTLINPEELVGGDAYNYIIAATRGVGYIAVGIVAALFANVSAVFYSRKNEELIKESVNNSNMGKIMDELKEESAL